MAKEICKPPPPPHTHTTTTTNHYAHESSGLSSTIIPKPRGIPLTHCSANPCIHSISCRNVLTPPNPRPYTELLCSAVCDLCTGYSHPYQASSHVLMLNLQLWSPWSASVHEANICTTGWDILQWLVWFPAIVTEVGRGGEILTYMYNSCLTGMPGLMYT